MLCLCIACFVCAQHPIRRYMPSRSQEHLPALPDKSLHSNYAQAATESMEPRQEKLNHECKLGCYTHCSHLVTACASLIEGPSCGLQQSRSSRRSRRLITTHYASVACWLLIRQCFGHCRGHGRQAGICYQLGRGGSTAAVRWISCRTHRHWLDDHRSWSSLKV